MSYKNITLTPAYGRDYRSAAAVMLDWKAEKGLYTATSGVLLQHSEYDITESIGRNPRPFPLPKDDKGTRPGIIAAFHNVLACIRSLWYIIGTLWDSIIGTPSWRK